MGLRRRFIHGLRAAVSPPIVIDEAVTPHIATQIPDLKAWLDDEISARLRDIERNLSNRVSAHAAELMDHINNQTADLMTHTNNQTADLMAHITQTQAVVEAYDDLLALYQLVGASHRELMTFEGREITVHTNKPVAYDSPDHIMPWGTKHDNSINLKFNAALARWIPLRELSVLDLGCAGGGFVKSILDMGCLAIGIEGSNYSKIRRRAEWATIPSYLWTADITEPFRVTVDGDREEPGSVRFAVITAWEVPEHIAREKLPAVFANVDAHLMKNGVVIASVSPNEEVINGVILHQTVEDEDWWIAECRRLGFAHHPELLEHFSGNWVRGGANAPGSFHLILTRADERPPYRERLRERLGAGRKLRRVRPKSAKGRREQGKGWLR